MSLADLDGCRFLFNKIVCLQYFQPTKQQSALALPHPRTSRLCGALPRPTKTGHASLSPSSLCQRTHEGSCATANSSYRRRTQTPFHFHAQGAKSAASDGEREDWLALLFLLSLQFIPQSLCVQGGKDLGLRVPLNARTRI